MFEASLKRCTHECGIQRHTRRKQKYKVYLLFHFFCVVLLGIEQMKARPFSKEISGFKQLF
jgi:hypothetical protein